MGVTDSGWQVMTGNPLRFVASAWPWRSIAYLLTSWIVAILWTSGMLVVMTIPALGLAALLGGIPFSAVERWRLRLLDPVPAVSPHIRLVKPGLVGWLSTRFRETTTWRELGCALLFALVLAWLDAAVGLLVFATLFLIAFPALVHFLPAYQPEALFGFVDARLPEALLGTVLGVLIMPLVWYVVTTYALGRAALTRTLLLGRRDTAQDEQMRELSRSRARIMDAMDAQRRRIERDLHDGAQQRLTGLIMTLGMARLRLVDAPPADRGLVDQAYQQARAALTELRELVHGIHPQVLTDRGLAPAVAELAERCSVPVEVDIALPRRPPEPVEAAAWFIISEALTNVAKHSKASRAWVRCRLEPEQVVVEVGDDGVGGADPWRGTGLVGLTDRVSVLDGRLRFSSPPGGPTVLRAGLPCAW